MEQIPKISLHNISFAYGDKQILDNISLNIFKGEKLCLLGANGSGKTSLLKIIANLLIPTSGKVLLDEKPASDVRKGEVCYVFQDAEYQIVASTVEEDVAFGAENLALPREEIEKRVTDSLEAVELSRKRYADVNCLSGGQKSCLVIADALAMKPSVLLLDDATSHLDKKGQEKIEQVLQRLHADGTTIISAEYSLSKIAHCDRVLVLKNGSIVIEKTPREILSMTDTELEKFGFLQIGIVDKKTDTENRVCMTD